MEKPRQIQRDMAQDAPVYVLRRDPDSSWEWRTFCGTWRVLFLLYSPRLFAHLSLILIVYTVVIVQLFVVFVYFFSEFERSSRASSPLSCSHDSCPCRLDPGLIVLFISLFLTLLSLHLAVVLLTALFEPLVRAMEWLINLNEKRLDFHIPKVLPFLSNRTPPLGDLWLSRLCSLLM